MATINISKVGKATSVEGVVVDFTEDVLREVVATYDPNLCEAPIVVGHPKLDSPSFGFIDRLSFADGKLVGVEDQVDPDFNELRRKGRFKHPSASFFTPTAPNNPTPGKWYLRHVGYLGGATPALKGLNGKAISFADADDGVVTVSFADGDLPAFSGAGIARMFRGLRDWLISKEGTEVADQLLPDWEIEDLRRVSQRAAEQTDSTRPFGSASFADPRTATQQEHMSTPKTPEQLQTELDAAKKQIQTLQNAERTREADKRHAEHVSFADTLITQARWPAGAKEVLVASLDHLATPVDSACVSFGDGEAARPLHEVLREQLQTLPESVSFGEVAGKGSGADKAMTNRQVSDRAAEYRNRMAAKGQHISMGQAIDAVQAGTDKE